MLANLGFNNSFNNSARKLSMLKSNSPQFQAHVHAVNAQIVNSSTVGLKFGFEGGFFGF